MKTHHCKTIQLLIIAAIFSIVCVPAAWAHDVSRDKGFYMGATIGGATIYPEDNPNSDFQIEDGGGFFTIKAGYSFNRVFSLEFAAVGQGYETTDPTINASLGSLQVMAMYHFRPGHQFRPYVKGGLGGYGLQLQQNNVSATANGGGVVLGGGIDYIFTRNFGMGIDFTHNIIGFDKVEVDFGGNTVGTEIDEDGAMTSVGLSFNVYF